MFVILFLSKQVSVVNDILDLNDINCINKGQIKKIPFSGSVNLVRLFSTNKSDANLPHVKELVHVWLCSAKEKAESDKWNTNEKICF